MMLRMPCGEQADQFRLGEAIEHALGFSRAARDGYELDGGVQKPHGPDCLEDTLAEGVAEHVDDAAVLGAPDLGDDLIVQVAHDVLQVRLQMRRSVFQLLVPRPLWISRSHTHTSPHSIR